MRADRLVSLVLLLRQRGRMTAGQLAAELEVSVRTVLRDIDALSSSGVPVYADRGRHGGYSVLPGFRTELTALTHDEALALLTTGLGQTDRAFGLSAHLASAMRKVVDAMPESQRTRMDAATRRFLVEPESDLLSRRADREDLRDGVIREVRRAVLSGKRLRFDYTASNGSGGMRVVDPLGLVTVRGRTYLLASKSGADRTYRLSRMITAEMLTEPAQRPASVDLDRIWAQRTERFLAEGHIPVTVRVRRTRLDELLCNARSIRTESAEADDWVRIDLTFEDTRHAVWAVWQLGTDAEVIAPDDVRTAIYGRAAELAARYHPSQ